jgi:hypothetical protein
MLPTAPMSDAAVPRVVSGTVPGIAGNQDDPRRKFIMNATNATRHRCPCCGFLTLHERGAYEICPVCLWEDDDGDEHFCSPAPERPRGPNAVHLWEARENFREFGAAESRLSGLVRGPRPEEVPGEGLDC